MKAPHSIVASADLRGNEFAWRPEDFPSALAEAARFGYRCAGGQFQFRFPDATCEMYWLESKAPDRASGEEWSAYVALNGRLLVAFGAAAKHCAFYPCAFPIAAHKDELKDYDTSKGTIRFQADKSLPVARVRKLVKTRIAENTARRRKSE